MNVWCSGRDKSVDRQVVGSTLQSLNFFGFLGFLEKINGGGHIKTPASVNGINGDGHLKAPPPLIDYLRRAK